MSDQPFISFSAHATGIDAWYSAESDRVTILMQGAASMTLSVKDAQGLTEKLGIALRDARPQNAAAEPTESGMTELDCALMQPAPQDEVISVCEADPREPSEEGRDHARAVCPYPAGCSGCMTEAESLAEAEPWNTATSGEVLTDWERDLLAQAAEDPDTEQPRGELSAEVRATLQDAGITLAEWRTWNHMRDKWTGDTCGCPDDRCIGFHHAGPDDCGCFPVLLEEMQREAAHPEDPDVDRERAIADVDGAL